MPCPRALRAVRADLEGVLAVTQTERAPEPAAGERERLDVIDPAHLPVDQERHLRHGAGDPRAPRHLAGDRLPPVERARIDLETDVLVLHEALRIREPPDEAEVEIPLPELSGIGVVVDAAALERIVRVRHLRV